jgi:hypothetical protein
VVTAPTVGPEKPSIKHRQMNDRGLKLFDGATAEKFRKWGWFMMERIYHE